MKFFNLDGKEISENLFYKTNTGIIHWNVGDIEYRFDGKTHRLGGPAYFSHIKDELFQEYYYIDGKSVSKENHDLLYNLMKLKSLGFQNQKLLIKIQFQAFDLLL